METIIYRLQDVLINYDYLRKPLSSMERKNFQGEYPYYGAQGIIDYVQEYRCDGEFLLIAEDGENLMSRNQPLALIVNGKFWVNNHAHIVKTNDLADMYYTCYALNHLDITGFVTGSAQPKLSQGNLNKIKIQFPPIEYQKRIVSVLSTYDSLIEVNKKRIKVLEQMAENLYKEWFVRFRFPGHEATEFENGIPKGWIISTLGTEARFINGRAYLMPELKDSGKYRIIRVGNFSGKEEWFYSDLELDPEKYCEQGDLLYKWSCAFGPEIWNEEKSIYHYHIWKVIPGKMVNKLYLYHYLNYYTQMWLGETNGAAMAHITKASMEKNKIIVPSSNILCAFDGYAQSFFQKIQSLKMQNDNLINQRDLLLPRLMSGKLEV